MKLVHPNYDRLSKEELIEVIYNLQKVIGVEFQVHRKYRLTEIEQLLLGLLFKRKGILTKEGAYVVMYGMHLEPPDVKIMDVWICKLRAKLRPWGIDFETVWGRGWALSDEMRERVGQMEVTESQTGDALPLFSASRLSQVSA